MDTILQQKMLKSRPKDALAKLVKAVEIAETVQWVIVSALTEALSKDPK